MEVNELYRIIQAELVFPDNELNFYLVAEGLKPAAWLLNKNRADYKVIGPSFSQLGLPWKKMDEGGSFIIGKDKKSFKKILKALEKKSDKEIGLAFGYPEDTVRYYRRVVDGELRDAISVKVDLARAREAGMELPTWLAYIHHIPARLDLVKGNVSESSMSIGKRYQHYVRENNPPLAERVEQFFLEYPLPTKWRKRANKGYDLYFENSEVEIMGGEFCIVCKSTM